MGNLQPVLRPVNAFVQEERRALPWMVQPFRANLAPDASCLEVQPSAASWTRYPTGRDLGVVAARAIGKGQPLASADAPISVLLNDGALDLGPILAAKSAVELEAALLAARARYYDPSVLQRVNVVMARDDAGGTWIVALRDIAQGEELLRCFGFSTWLKELLELGVLPSSALPGLFNYVVAMATQMEAAFDDDPFGTYMQMLILQTPDLLRQLYPALPHDARDSAAFDAWFAAQAQSSVPVQVLATRQGFRARTGDAIRQVLGRGRNQWTK